MATNNIGTHNLSNIIDLTTENVVYTYKNQYKVNGIDNFDFFNELNKEENEENTVVNDEDYEKKQNFRCLISNEPLVEPIITMPCGHKFNYIPLVRDAVSFVLLSVRLSGSSYSYLKTDSMKYSLRCPYCRVVVKRLLPYYKIEDFVYLHQVHINPEFQCLDYDVATSGVPEFDKYYRCEFIYENPYYNKNMPDSFTNCPSLRCGSSYCHEKTYVKLYTNKEKTEQKICRKNVLKKYCSYHMKNMKNSLKNDSSAISAISVKSKENESNKSDFINVSSLIKSENVIVDKDNKEGTVFKEGVVLEEDKKYSPSELKKIQTAYISIKKKDSEKTPEDWEKQGEYAKILNGVSLVSLMNYDCIEVMKKGKRKGEMCSRPVYLDFMCKRHYRDYLKKTVVE